MDAATLAKIRGGMAGLAPPQPRQKVGNRECAYSFDSPYAEGGLFVNLKTFAGCGRDFVQKDASRSQTVLYAHHRWTKTPKEDVEMSEPTTLGVGVQGGFESEDARYDIVKVRSLAVVSDDVTLIQLPCSDIPEYVTMLVDACLDHESGTAESDRAWALVEDEAKPSKYADTLIQLKPEEGGRCEPLNPDPASWRCELDGSSENLWLNLSTGYVGGGRDQSAWGGPKGSNGALRHFESTGKKYPLVVKLGTISAAGAELYSYAPDEDGPVLDPKLADHLRFWGINIMSSEKTEKTTAELEVDANQKFEWSAIAEQGAQLTPLAGVGLTGLVNLGNSCYMNSVLHLLASVPEIGRRYHGLVDDTEKLGPAALSLVNVADPSNDHLAQTARFISALRSKRYAKPTESLVDPSLAIAERPTLSSNIATKAAAATVAPRGFRALFGKGHVEFSTPRQQDAAEYLIHVLDTLSKAEAPALAADGRLTQAAEQANAEKTGPVEYGPYDVLSSQPTQQLFAFKVEEKTTCLQSQKVRYKAQTEFTLALEVPESIVPRPPVEQEAKKPKLEDVAKPRCPLDACLSHWAATESVVDYTSPATGLRGEASRHTRLQTCPRYLLVKINRYYATADWTEKKLDVLVEVPAKLDLSQLRAPSQRPAGEEELPDDAAPPKEKFVPDPGILAQLLSMGFDENGCKRACKATNNAGPEAASEWVFSHMDDADFSAPFVDDDAPSEKKVDEAAVNELVMFGFTPREAEAALVACSGNKEHAANWLFEQGDNRDQAVADVLDGPSAAAAPAAPSDFDDGPPYYELKGLVSHIGSNTGCGHYVAHIREKDGRWVIFDDEKVAHSKSPPVQLAYLYLYARK
jgi:ubiquitin carboxyl-terminal hydrolase 5/13